MEILSYLNRIPKNCHNLRQNSSISLHFNSDILFLGYSDKMYIDKQYEIFSFYKDTILSRV